MISIVKRRALVLLLAVTITAYSGYGFACSAGSTAIKSFRLALAASGPLVNSLAATGAIPQSRTTAIIADFDAGAQCGLTLQDEFTAAKDDSDERAQKLVASTKAFKCFRAILDRQNFAAHPRLQQIANIADGVLASLVIFYSDGQTIVASKEGTMTAMSNVRAAATISARTEQDLERQMEAQMKALELAMRP